MEAGRSGWDVGGPERWCRVLPGDRLKAVGRSLVAWSQSASTTTPGALPRLWTPSGTSAWGELEVNVAGGPPATLTSRLGLRSTRGRSGQVEGAVVPGKHAQSLSDRAFQKDLLSERPGRAPS